MENEYSNYSDIKVCRSDAGFFIGREMNQNVVGFTAPFIRHSQFFKSEDEALNELNRWYNN